MRNLIERLEEARIPRKTPDEGDYTAFRRRAATVVNRNVRAVEDELEAMRDLMTAVHTYIDVRWSDEDDAGDGGGSKMLQAAEDLMRDFEMIREKAEILR